MINEELKKLEPVDAARAWLEGEFGYGDEPALIQAIRKDTRITLSDEEIIDFMSEAIEEDLLDAQGCLDRMADME